MARYRKLPKSGKHYFRRKGEMICVLPGETIEAEPHELGGAITTYECLDPPPPPAEPTRGLFAKHVGGGRYNVINEATGNPINDELLSKGEAEALVEEKLDEEDDASRDDGQAGDDGDADNED